MEFTHTRRQLKLLQQYQAKSIHFKDPSKVNGFLKKCIKRLNASNAEIDKALKKIKDFKKENKYLKGKK